MKAGIDISSLHSLSKQRGIGFYAQNLIHALREYTEIEVTVIEDGIRGVDVEIIHYPFFDLFSKTLPFQKKIPTIVTIHDVTPLVFPEHYPPGIKGKVKNFFQKLSLRNVKAVITDSEHSKKDIEKYLNVVEEQIFPVYLACSEEFKLINDKKALEKTRKKFNLPEKFALFVGSVNWNKNLVNLVEACTRAEMNLVLVGKDFERKDNLNHPELQSYKFFLENYASNSLIHRFGYVKTEELVNIYNLAEMILLPSYYEGFGLPILEAQTCGTAVITSNTSSMPEVAGEGAIFINPEKVEEIVEAILSLESIELREKIIKKGFENIKRFSWEKTALQTERVYEWVLKS